MHELGYCSTVTPKLVKKSVALNGIMVKQIPSWIGEFFTPLGLASWIMQDGSRQMKQGIHLATNSFTYEECIFFKWNIER